MYLLIFKMFNCQFHIAIFWLCAIWELMQMQLEKSTQSKLSVFVFLLWFLMWPLSMKWHWRQVKICDNRDANCSAYRLVPAPGTSPDSAAPSRRSSRAHFTRLLRPGKRFRQLAESCCCCVPPTVTFTVYVQSLVGLKQLSEFLVKSDFWPRWRRRLPIFKH